MEQLQQLKEENLRLYRKVQQGKEKIAQLEHHKAELEASMEMNEVWSLHNAVLITQYLSFSFSLSALIISPFNHKGAPVQSSAVREPSNQLADASRRTLLAHRAYIDFAFAYPQLRAIVATSSIGCGLSRTRRALAPTQRGLSE